MNKQDIWNAVDVPNDCPEDCYWLVATPDVFGVGDSPTSYECVCEKAKDCPIVQEKINDPS